MNLTDGARVVVGLAPRVSPDGNPTTHAELHDTGVIIFGGMDHAMVAAAVIQWAIDQGADRDEILAYA